MNWDWFKKFSKENPKFWENYLSSFETPLNDEKYIVFDCETTGLNSETDRILSIAAVSIKNNQIIVSDFMEIFLQQEVFNSNSVEYHGILKDGKEEKFVEAEAVIQFLKFAKNATLVGHQINFDIEMINEALSRLSLGTLKNQYMDIGLMHQKLIDDTTLESISLDELCNIYKVKKNGRHTASGDAYITAILFLKLKKKLSI
ncbi:3'-5' exonuclease [Flavobacterium sp.]|jgi:DNA polymerase-3 subunit epsilon|uniref:3'-5' exonuclease n=1 Tax=Flavobacterium sp. TaxID=239 RepID=UPI003D26FC15